MSAQKSTSSRQLPGAAGWQRILKEIQARTAPTRPRTIKVGAPIKEIAHGIRQRQTPRFFGLMPEQAALFVRFFPEPAQSIVDQAERLMKHQFEIPGVGNLELDKQIDWHMDFYNKTAWPVVHTNRMRLHGLSRGNPRSTWAL